MAKKQGDVKKKGIFTNAEKKTIIFWFDLFYVIAASIMFMFLPATAQNPFATFQIGAVMPILVAINTAIGFSVVKDKTIPSQPPIPPKG